MKLLLVLIAAIFFSGLNNNTAQTFFPLEVGNEWYFENYYDDMYNEPRVDTFTVRIQKDTIMSNGQTYYELSREAFFYAKYLRVDSNCVFVYDDKEEKDIKLIDLTTGIGERREVLFNYIGFVELYDVDSVDVLGYQSINKTYRLDGLILSYLTLSNKFGPIWRYSPGEPPGTSVTIENLIGCQISDTSYGYIVSVKEKNKLVSDFSLSQNYPNPFNPSTKIKFNIPNVETTRRVVSTKMTVYDVLGRKVKTLVNKNLSPGSYEVEFNGNNFTSGVYFYILESGGMRLSRKMLLIK